MILKVRPDWRSHDSGAQRAEKQAQKLWQVNMDWIQPPGDKRCAHIQPSAEVKHQTQVAFSLSLAC